MAKDHDVQRYQEVIKAATELAESGETCALRICLMNFAQEAAERKYDTPVADFLDKAYDLMKTANYQGTLTAALLLNTQVVMAELEKQLSKVSSSSL